MSSSAAPAPSFATPPAEMRPVAPPVEPEPRLAAGSFVQNLRTEMAAPITSAPRGGGSLSSAVAELVAEGLSDRAIARQLHIGLEEVRMARVRVGR